MTTADWILIIAGAVAVAGLLVIATAVRRSRRTRRQEQLRGTFGPEYDRTVGAAGSRRAAEQELTERQRQREKLEIKPLSEAARSRHLEEWSAVQQRFLDDPAGAVGWAERLVQRVLDERGYPDEEDADTRTDVISVDHPDVVQRYRHGREMAHAKSTAGADRTENLRKAMVDFRAVLEALLEPEREPLVMA